jgi:DNA polymerase III alpha subunit
MSGRTKRATAHPYFKPNAHTACVRVSEFQNHLGAEIHSSLLVVSKQLRPKKNGDSFLQLHLADASGQVEANVWYNVLEADKAFESGHVVEVVGPLSTYQDRLQITVERLRRIPDAEINLAEYPPGTTGKPDEFSSETCYLEHGKWLGTDANAQVAARSQTTLEELTRKHTQSVTPRPVAKPVPKTYNSAEMRQKPAESRARTDEMRRKYGPDRPGSLGRDEDF